MIELGMEHPKICLTLTGRTLEEDLEILDKYRKYIDIAELRADFLSEDERLYVKRFPQIAGVPCILTIRRVEDGGQFKEGEASRTMLFARVLALTEDGNPKNFDYIDFEEDFHIPCLQDAAVAFGTKVIRSFHDMQNPVRNIREKLDSLKQTGFEIPKIAFMPHTLDDVTNLFEEAEKLDDDNHILVAMGPLGVPSRILSAKLKNFLTFTSPAETNSKVSNLGHMDPITLNEIYHFKSIDKDSSIYGITGWPLAATSSPQLHNAGFEEHHLNAVYIPVRAETFEQAFHFANSIGIKGMSVTVPHKEAVMERVFYSEDKVDTIGASNTIVRGNDGMWKAYNTDASGFARSLMEFTGLTTLAGKKVSIIGAGGAAKAVAFAIKKLHGKACIFNRTVSKAKDLAEKYGFEYAGLPTDPSDDSLKLARKYNNIIIQTTSKGMGCRGPSTVENDPWFYYKFTGKEIVFDIIYVPETTPIMSRALEAGCRICNGYDMLCYQGYEQFELFTGKKY